MNKLSIVSLAILSSLSLNACGSQGVVNQVPLRMTTVSLDPSACYVRPQTKMQGLITDEQSSFTQTTPSTPVLTSVSTVKTPVAKVEVKKDTLNLDLGNIPEVKAPPSSNVKATPIQPEEKPKTKVGQFIDKVKNIFKKNS